MAEGDRPRDGLRVAMRGEEDPRAAAIRAGYATVARAYAEHLGDELAGKPLDRALLDAVAELTRGAGRVVDVGCGPGQIAAYLATRGTEVEGLDLSPAMVAEARARYPALAFREGDMRALPYGDGELAAVVAFYAIVHMPTAEVAGPCREWARVVAPGGRVVVAFHVGDACAHVEDMWGCATDLEFYFHPAEAVGAALVGAGLVIEARLDREPNPAVEHASQRCYLIARRPVR